MSTGANQRQSAEWRAGYSPYAGLPFDPEQLEARVLWIWGPPRSGSTWLLRMLCDPARIDARLPLGFRAPRSIEAPLPAVPFNEFLISHHLVPMTAPPRKFGKLLLPESPNVHMADRSSYALARDFEQIWRAELRRLVLVRLAAGIDRARDLGMELAADPLLVIKEVNGTHAARFVMDLFPRSRMLLLVRDGRDVIDSRAHALSGGGWMTRPGAEPLDQASRLGWISEAATQWASQVDVGGLAFDDHAPELRSRLRYEDLLAEPERELGSLFKWLGRPADAEQVAATVAAHAFERLPADRRGSTRHARAAVPGLWRKNLSSDEQRVAAEIMGDRLEALGYGD